MRARRTIEDYETEGRRFYRLAEGHPAARLMDLADVFALLRENFTSARKPLAFIASRYLHSKRHHLFGPLSNTDERTLNPSITDSYEPGFPILGVFRLNGQPNRDNGMIFGSCKASQSPVYPIRDAILAVNHASCPSFSSSVPRQWGESALKTSRLPGALSPSWQDRGCTLPQLGAGDNRPIRSNTPWNNRRGTDISDN